MWDPHKAFIGHHYFHIFKKNALVKENVCKLNTCFFTKAISLHKKSLRGYLWTSISQYYRMGPSYKVVVTELDGKCR